MNQYRARSSGVPKPLVWALLLLAGLYCLCGAAEALGRLRHWGYPYVWPLAPPFPPFVDFTAVMPRFAGFGTSRFFTAPGFPFTYPAAMAPVFEGFAVLPHALPIFLAFVMLGFVGAGVVFWRAVRGCGAPVGVAGALLLAYAVSFPLWFDLQQANCEAVVWMVVSLGLWAYLRDRPELAAVCFGLAGARKLYPFIFLGLLLARRRYRAVAWGVVTAVVATAVSLWLETRSIGGAWRGTSAGLEYFREHWALGPEGSGFDHSLFGLLKRMAGLGVTGQGVGHLGLTAEALRLYLLVGGVAVVLVYFSRVQWMPALNQILALTVLAVVIPPVSFDYTLIHLYVPCALVVLFALRFGRGGEGWPRGLTAVLLLLAVLMAPETEVIRHGVSLGGEVKCLALLALLVVALRYPLVEAVRPEVPPVLLP